MAWQGVTSPGEMGVGRDSNDAVALGPHGNDVVGEGAILDRCSSGHTGRHAGSGSGKTLPMLCVRLPYDDERCRCIQEPMA